MENNNDYEYLSSGDNVEATNVSPKKRKGKALFIVSCVFFALAVLINVYFILLWSDVAFKVLSGEKNDEIWGLILSIIFLFPIWLVVTPIPNIVAITLTAISVKNYKIPALILLLVTVLTFVANVLLVVLFLFTPKNDSSALIPLISEAARFIGSFKA